VKRDIWTRITGSIENLIYRCAR